MSKLIDDAQKRQDARRRELGIRERKLAGIRFDPERLRQAHERVGKEVVRAQLRGRRVKCVECGHESRIETNRNRRLKTLSCEQINVDGRQSRCGGRLRPLNWFRVSEER